MKSKEQKYKEAVVRNLRGIHRSNQDYLKRSFNTAKLILATDGEVALGHFITSVLDEMSAIDSKLNVHEVARRAGIRRSDLDKITNSNNHEWENLLLDAKRPIAPQFKTMAAGMIKITKSNKKGKR